MRYQKFVLFTFVPFLLLFSLIACSNQGGQVKSVPEKSENCLLIVDVQAFGWTDDGTNLSDHWIDRILVNKGDSVYETYPEGHYTTEVSENSVGEVFMIKSIGNDVITVQFSNQDKEILFGEIVEMESLGYTCDGQNYIFRLHFERTE